jgi:pilus assembly protein Flp/PilA
MFVRRNTGGYLMDQLFLRFLRNDSGVTAIEYALLSAGITVVLIAGATSLGNQLIQNFMAISTAM